MMPTAVTDTASRALAITLGLDKVDRDKALKIAGLAFAGYLVLKVMKAFSGGKGSGKTMKAPGRPFRIPRSPFESNPRGYFRQLHSDGL
ncbi:hypothetical protein AMTR_s00063p00213410 [Amborella trichopoda]|uniref:Uncharacterized protein n=1 Tax=Amborella trichopoda TaxID=13333 RepID=U5D7H0_AMBTC|nr:hypothetical protein AMTR_s00063p00213410 [Amborella trichopoda]